MSTSKHNPFEFSIAGQPALPKLRGVFVTGTDTGVGKTMVAGAIARHLRRCGRKVEVFKPAASGCRRTREGLVSADAEFLAACADSHRLLTDITPVRYAAALAPNVAAERKKKPVDLQAIFDAYADLKGHCECVVVEGVGGLLCPISDDFWVVHLARMMRLPLVIVARAELGTINHTLLTIHAARTAGLQVAGVVVNRYHVDPAAQRALQKETAPPPADADVAMYTNPAQIAARGGVKVLALVPDDPASSVSTAKVGQDVQFAIDQVPWEAIAALD